MSKSIFIFRRDFRVQDNKGFIKCFEESEDILPIFIFTPEQVDKNKNEYYNSNAIQFMIESLNSLDKELKKTFKSKLYYFYGDNFDVLKKIKKEFDFDSIYFNMDYTPYAKKRDEEIEKYCLSENIKCIKTEDYLLYPMGTIVKKDGLYYQKYTPFKNVGIKMTPDKPIIKKYKSGKLIKNKKFDLEIENEKINKFYTNNPHLLVKGGREEALDILKHAKEWNAYKEYRNDLSYNTTHLSAYIKFGCVSIREVYWDFKEKVGLNNGIIEQLLWREFYFYLINYLPQILSKGEPQHEKFAFIDWKNNKDWFDKWKEGKTGFPVVDAGMREMNQTGYMHNRARLITCSIGVKVLQLDWRWTEKYYAQMFVDYDPSVNNGNNQWCSGTGENPQDYWRFFSPWKQAQDYDPNCEYIKKWVPELKDIPNDIILKWNEKNKEWKDKTTYPKPLVDFDAALRESTLDIYRESFKVFDEKEKK